jgi:hypothetical protein
VDTVFNAWNTLRRNLVKEAMPRLMTDHPQALKAALQVVNGNLIQYALASLERGTAGLSIGKTEEKMGIRGSNTTEVILENVKVPVSQRIGDEGVGWWQMMAGSVMRVEESLSSCWRQDSSYSPCASYIRSKVCGVCGRWLNCCS